jgi:hypothetical protein
MTKRSLHSIFTLTLLVIFLLGNSKKIYAQTATINNTVGAYSGNVISGGRPYHAMEAIYLVSEFGTIKFNTAATAITRIEFSLNVGSPATYPATITDSFRIYLKNVSAATSLFASGTTSYAGYTKVYDGSISFNNVGWNGVNLTTSFTRTATSNLQMLVVRNNGDSSHAGLFIDCSTGNATNTASTTLSARRYNGGTPFNGTTSLTASGFRPAIQFIHQFATDVKTSSITLPPASSCFTSPQNIAVTIKNTGITNTIAAGAASVKLSIAGGNTYTASKLNATTIAIGGSETITFSNINLGLIGTNSIQALTTVSGDGDKTNDTAFSSIITTDILSTFPIDEGAEAPLTAFKYLRSLNPVGAASNWYRLTSNYGNSLLSDSITPNNGAAYYFYYTPGAASGTKGLLYSDCIAVPASAATAVSFFMTHDSSLSTRLDSIYVSASTDKGATWNRVGGFQRYDAAATNLTYQQHTVNVSAYAGQTVQFGFEGVSKGGNAIGLDDINFSTVLPIKLNSFIGSREGNKNVLNWQTANEINNKGFELQRSTNGKEFTSIATVNSKAENGNSATILNYSYSDDKYFATTNYYRLIQLDRDGKSSYSNIVLVKSPIVKTEISRMYPNPVKEKLNVVLTTLSASKLIISVTDLVGKTIATKSIETTQGDNIVSFNTAPLAAGTYLVKVYAANTEIATEKFIKQ